MNRFIKLILIVSSLTLLAFSADAGSTGKGELKLNDEAVRHFIKYIRGKGSKSPMRYIISSDSSWSMYWYCPYGVGACRDDGGGALQSVKKCEDKTGIHCGTFAMGRTVVWKNGINVGKGKASRINSKWSDSEIRAKLTEWGFLGEATATTTTKKKEKKKLEKKKEKKTTEKSSDDNIVIKLKELKELFDSGALTEEEYKKAKEKLLN